MSSRFELKSIMVSNFLSISSVSLDFNPGLHLVSGINKDDDCSLSNGAGKSSLIEAIIWSIYGETSRDLDNADSVINWTTGKDCEVVLVFDFEGIKYTIKRFRGLSGQNGLTLLSDATDCSSHLTSETQKTIEEMIGLSKERFRQTVLLDGGLGSRFTALTDTWRKRMIEDVTDLQIWDRSTTRTNRRLDDLKSSITSVKSTRDLTAADLVKEEARVGQIKDLMLQSLEQSTDYSGQITDSTVHRDESSNNVDSLTQELTEITSLARALEVDVESSSSLVRISADEVRECYGELAIVNNQIIVADKLKSQGKCQTCGQSVKDSPYLAQYDGLICRKDDLSTRLSELESERAVAEECYKSLVAKHQQAKSRIGELNQLIRLNREQVSFHQGRIDYLEKLSRESTQVDSNTEILSQVHERIEHLGQRISEYDAELAKYQDELQYVKYWSDAFPKLRIATIERVLEYINQRLTEYSKTLTDGDEEIKLEIKKDKIQVYVSVGGKLRKYSNRSSGERRRTDLAIQLALNDLAVEITKTVPSLLVLDEVLDTLDIVAVERVLRLLVDRANHVTMLVTTHSSDVRDKIPEGARELMMIKSGGMTTMETM